MNLTKVTTDGKVLHQGTDGVVIVDSMEQPILKISEVSDDEVINVFLMPNSDGKTSGIVKNEELADTWEILRNR